MIESDCLIVNFAAGFKTGCTASRGLGAAYLVFLFKLPYQVLSSPAAFYSEIHLVL